MPYNNYFPAGYQPLYYPQYQQQQQQPAQQNNGIIWVQGEAGAKSYLVAPNMTVMLMDSENNQFFIKSADGSGMPTLRLFKYEEVVKTPAQAVENGSSTNTTEYVEKREFEAFRRQIEAYMSHSTEDAKPKKGVKTDE